MRDTGTNTWTVYASDTDGGGVDPTAPWDSLANPTVEDLLPAGLALWPRGALWGTPDGMAPSTKTTLAAFTRVLLSPFALLYRRAWRLTLESRATTLEESLADWEADYGLPDGCAAATSNVAARKRALLAKVRSVGVMTPEDYVRHAYRAGYDISIEEPVVFECGFSECGGEHTVGDRLQEVYWIVHVYGLAIDYFTCGESESGQDLLFDMTAVNQLICMFKKLYPAWTQPVYVIHDSEVIVHNGEPIAHDGSNLVSSYSDTVNI